MIGINTLVPEFIHYPVENIFIYCNCNGLHALRAGQKD